MSVVTRMKEKTFNTQGESRLVTAGVYFTVLPGSVCGWEELLPPRDGSATIAITHLAASFHDTRPQAVLVSFHRALINTQIAPNMDSSHPPSKPAAGVFLRGSRAAQVASVCLNSRAVPPRLQFDSAPFNYKLRKSYFLSGASPANVNTISRKFCSQENLFVSGQLERHWCGLV